MLTEEVQELALWPCAGTTPTALGPDGLRADSAFWRLRRGVWESAGLGRSNVAVWEFLRWMENSSRAQSEARRRCFSPRRRAALTSQTRRSGRQTARLQLD